MKVIFILIMLLCSAKSYSMGYYEIGVNGSVTKFYNSETSYTKTNTIGVSLAYRFTSISAIQLAYTNIFQLVTAPYSSTRGIIDVASINLLIYVLGNRFSLQPYVKGGVGYMNKRYTYVTDGYPTIEIKDESTTATFGAGLKYMLTGNLALQGEATGYISDSRAGSYFINYTITAGISLIF